LATLLIGIPGSEVNDVIIAIGNSKKIKYILARDENNAAFIASGYSAMGGKCVCVSTLGPGALKMVMPVTNALQDRIPLIVLSGETDQSVTYRELHQRAPVREIFEKITKDAVAIPNNEPENISNIVSNAFKKSYEEKPGPYYIGLPVNIAKQRITKYVPPKGHGRARRPDPDQPVLDFISNHIRKAKNPLIIAGSGILRERPIETTKILRTLAEQHAIPVITTLMGKSAISNRSPLYVGTLGVDSKAQEFINNADIIIAIGYEFAEYGPERWNKSKTERIIHFDYTSAEENYSYPLIHHPTEDWNSQVIADIKRSLEELNNRLVGHTPENSKETLEKVENIQLERKKKMRDISSTFPSAPFHPLTAIAAIQESISFNDYIICGVGTVKSLLPKYLEIEKANHFYVPNTLSPMGLALPFAIGVKLAKSENRVIAICGDGSFKMSHSELEVAVEKEIPITVVIFNNNQLALISQKQQRDFGKVFGTEFDQATDYVKMAESMGSKAFRINSQNEIRNVLNTTVNLNEPVVIDIPVRIVDESVGRL